jgi:predicted nucleic acid-binding protein
MSFVFLDTVGLLALWDEADQWHGAAESAWEKILVERAIPYTTPQILLECGNAASRKAYRPTVDLVRQQFERTQRLVDITREEWGQAWEAYVKAGPGGAGIVDHISFIVMRRIGISDVFSNDRHFKAARFNTLF